MKKIYHLLIAMFISIALFSQAPDAINYQMVIRDLNGQILPNTSLSMRVSILRSAPDGAVVYSETHNVSSNQNGLVRLAIGQGTPEAGDFPAISWAEDTYYLDIGIDFTGGGNYLPYGTQQLLSVPYALNAREADHASGLSLYGGGQEFILKVNEFGELYLEKGEFTCGELLFDNRDGQSYETIQIGSQCWMKQNLNYETDSSWCYSNDTANCEIYGRLYAHNTALKACPSGWHLPDDDEWCELLTYIDPTVNCSSSGITGTDAGGKMKTTGVLGVDGLWSAPNTGATNESGFSALPGGFRHTNFLEKNNIADFWSASVAGQDWYYFWQLKATNAEVFHYSEAFIFGFSVRCVKDE